MVFIESSSIITTNSSPSTSRVKAPSKTNLETNSPSLTRYRTTILIGISGTSSSGKSTLAFLLNEIFNSSSSHTANIIHQDAFFKPKTQAPTIAFESADTPSDIDYVSRSVTSNTIRLYTYAEIGGQDDGRKWKIQGPNLDCPAAVDFETLTQKVEGLRSGNGMRDEVQVEGGGAEIPGVEACAESLRSAYAPLIAEMRVLVEKCKDHMNSALLKSDEKALVPCPIRFCFVEGFLLFCPPLALMSRVDDQRRYLMSLLDIRLFLLVPMSVAKARRLERKSYIDREEGGLRVPGQMWRSEGYFDCVVWEQYLREYAWLLGDWDSGKGREEDDIVVREGEGSVEETVRWAVDVILRKASLNLR